MYVEEKGGDGTAKTWMLEGSATTLVERNGTRRSDLVSNIGKAVTVRACPGRNSPTRGAAETIKLADGREMVVGGVRYSGEKTGN